MEGQKQLRIANILYWSHDERFVCVRPDGEAGKVWLRVHTSEQPFKPQELWCQLNGETLRIVL